MTLKYTLAVLATALSACTSNNVSQFALEIPNVETARATGLTVEVLEISLPLYAQSQEIPMRDVDGAIKSDPAVLWADEPTRSISLGLAETLSRMTGGVAAVEPWPLDDRAAYRLDVRVSELVATPDNTLKFSGQFFVINDDGRRPKVEWFDLTVPIAGSDGQSVARATSQAVVELSGLIAAKIR